MPKGIIDLFCGVGGFSLGAARASLPLLAAIDNDPRMLSAYHRNFAPVKHWLADLSKCSGRDLLRNCRVDREDILGVMGGPPCQGFSIIGKNHANDPRNRLFVDFFRLVSELRPIFYVAENVPGILREKNKPLVSRALNHIDKFYAQLPPLSLAAGDFHVPTSRQRIFFIGFRRDISLGVVSEDIANQSSSKRIKVKHALKGLPTKISPNWQREEDGWRTIGLGMDGYYGERIRGSIPKGVGDPVAIRRLELEKQVSGCLGTAHTTAVIDRFERTEPGKVEPISRAYRLDPEGLCPTIRAGTRSDHGGYQSLRPIHPTEPRVITPREAARLQGFPDWFQFDSTKWRSFMQIGNSVSPILAERLLLPITKALGKANLLESTNG